MVEREFYLLIRDIIKTKEFQEMKKYKHHIKSNLYIHSIRVAYFCFKYHKKHKLKVSINEFVRGALLHDFYLYNLHGGTEKHRFHWIKHPKIALENALKRYPDLTKTEQDMIKHHMFPLTIIPPKTKAGWVVCFYDKVAAFVDRFGKNKKLKRSNK